MADRKTTLSKATKRDIDFLVYPHFSLVYFNYICVLNIPQQNYVHNNVWSCLCYNQPYWHCKAHLELWMELPHNGNRFLFLCASRFATTTAMASYPKKVYLLLYEMFSYTNVLYIIAWVLVWVKSTWYIVTAKTEKYVNRSWRVKQRTRKIPFREIDDNFYFNSICPLCTTICATSTLSNPS